MDSTNAVTQTEIKQIAENTNNVLQLNITSVDKAKEFGNSLIARIQESGMNDSLDTECNDFLVKVKKTLTLVQERRKPITQLFDTVKSHFTALENELDPHKGEVYSTVQKFRDDFARAKAEEARRKEEEARKKLEAEKEKAAITAKLETALAEWFNGFLTTTLSSLQEWFNKTTLEGYIQTADAIGNVTITYPREHFAQFKSNIQLVYITQEDFDAIQLKVIEGKYDKFAQEFAEKVNDMKQDLLDKLPSKKKELEAIAKAEKEDDEEAARLKAEAEKREEEEKLRLAEEAAERGKTAQDEAESKKSESEMESLFNATQETASAESSGSQVRKSWIIEVTHQAGYVQIFQMWFEGEGTKLALDKFARKNLGQMVKFCESLANKHDTRIDSPYIKYKEDFKAIAKS